ncbi:MAG: HNH endonuclease signature motif containing protein [Pseudomonadota bacterium]|nr:HNH endonuclease signature motif containing protein [Pseudomonadota bacterium]
MSGRSVPLWSGKTADTAIPPKVKRRVLDRAGDCCEGCGRKVGPGGEAYQIDHVLALINGGTNTEDNLQVLCTGCHGLKTKEDVAVKAKIARVRNKHMGLHKAKRKIPGSKGTGMRKPLWGQAYRVEE